MGHSMILPVIMIISIVMTCVYSLSATVYVHGRCDSDEVTIRDAFLSAILKHIKNTRTL